MTNLHKEYDLTIRNVKHQGEGFTIGSDMACIDDINYEIVNDAFSGEMNGVKYKFYLMVKCTDVKFKPHECGCFKDMDSEVSYFIAVNTISNNVELVQEVKKQTYEDKHLDGFYVGTTIETYRFARESFLQGSC